MYVGRPFTCSVSEKWCDRSSLGDLQARPNFYKKNPLEFLVCPKIEYEAWKSFVTMLVPHTK